MNLKNPPDGGKLRPWEAIGMSRASWYRHGKPTEKPVRRGQGPFSQRAIARHDRISIRTVQRVERVIAFDPHLSMLMFDGNLKPAQAERIITDPLAYQRFLEWYTEQLNLTEYVCWIVGRQLDELENLYPKRRAPFRGIRKLGDGETVIYLPAQ